MFRKPSAVSCLSVVLVLVLCTALPAEDAPWQTLFDGTDLSAWQHPGGESPSAGWVIEDGQLVRKDRAGCIWTKERFSDFCLELEYKTAGNSGVFFRTDDLRNPVQTGIEVQILDPSASPSRGGTGALYDLLAPSEAADRPAIAESYPEQIMFAYQPGRTRDYRPHVRIYALRKNVRWTVN